MLSRAAVFPNIKKVIDYHDHIVSVLPEDVENVHFINLRKRDCCLQQLKR